VPGMAPRGCNCPHPAACVYRYPDQKYRKYVWRPRAESGRKYHRSFANIFVNDPSVDPGARKAPVRSIRVSLCLAASLRTR